jgi:putative restriction endonuclease
VSDANEAAIRQAAFDHIAMLEAVSDGVLNRHDLTLGFDYRGTRVPLVSAQGIFKPAVLELPLSITTVAVREGQERPYEDRLGTDGLLHYKYRGTDPSHRDNVGLREAMRRGTPLVYFHGTVPGKYVAAYPVFIVGDDSRALTFTVAVDDLRLLKGTSEPVMADDETTGRRRYVTRTTIQRLHQQEFRERVLRAYRSSCSICRLRHERLLDAAHILPDAHPEGEPWTSNGLSLCKIHHAAFDANILGITPELIVEIRSDVLREIDGPMLQHGLQDLHGQRLAVLPRRSSDQPRPAAIAARYEIFRRTG